MPASNRPSKSAAPSDIDLSSQRHDELLVEFGTPDALAHVFQAEYDMIDALGPWSFTTIPLVLIPGRSANQVIGYIDREVHAQRIVVCQHCVYLRDNVLLRRSWEDDPRNPKYLDGEFSLVYLTDLLQEVHGEQDVDEELNVDHENTLAINNGGEGVPMLDDLMADENPDDIHLPRCSTHIAPWRLRRMWHTYLRAVPVYNRWLTAYKKYQQGTGPLPSDPEFTRTLRVKTFGGYITDAGTEVPPIYYKPIQPTEPCPPTVNAEEIAACDRCQIHRTRSCPTHRQEVVTCEDEQIVYQETMQVRAGFLLWATPPSVGEMLRDIRTYQTYRQEIDLWVVVVDTTCPNRQILQDADIVVVERDGTSWTIHDRDVTWGQMQADYAG